MSLSRPTAQRFGKQLAVKSACLAGALVMLFAILASPAMAWKGHPRGGGHGSGSSSSGGSGSAGGGTTTAEGCANGDLSKPFARFGDAAWYTPIEGGDFESGSGGWSLSNAGVAWGNESYNVAGGSHSLAIQPGGEAVSPAFCVDIARPTMRFFARQTSGSWAVLNVALRWKDSSGATHQTTIGSLQGNSEWAPTPILALGSSLPLWQAQDTLMVRLVLDPENYGGAWAVDDVYIDPRMR